MTLAIELQPLHLLGSRPERCQLAVIDNLRC
jgi:hypothetical protein